MSSEENWSSILAVDTTKSFARHDMQEVRFRDKKIRISSVPDLSPLDMVHLSQGTHDATGHKVWLGASMFVMAAEQGDVFDGNFFARRKVLELGCGTGLAGISLSFLKEDEAPSSVVLSDSDEATLDLCRSNCCLNGVLRNSNTFLTSKTLCWGRSLESSDQSAYDTVIATDILYSIEALEPFLQTARDGLVDSGHLILVHVPRASMPGEAKVASAETLEEHINETAKRMGFIHAETIRPSQIQVYDDDDDDDDDTLKVREELQSVGAAILVFQKKSRVHLELPVLSNYSHVVVEASKLLSYFNSRYEQQAQHLLMNEFGTQHQLVNGDDNDLNEQGKIPHSLVMLEVDGNAIGKVIGHVHVIEKPGHPMTRSKAKKLLDVGITEAAVRRMLELQGKDYDEMMQGDNETGFGEHTLETSVGALVVEPSLRGKGFGKVLAQLAVAWSVHLGARKVNAYARTEALVQWYGRMGATIERDSMKRPPKSMNWVSLNVEPYHDKSLQELVVMMKIPKRILVVETMKDLPGDGKILSSC